MLVCDGWAGALGRPPPAALERTGLLTAAANRPSRHACLLVAAAAVQVGGLEEGGGAALHVGRGSGRAAGALTRRACAHEMQRRLGAVRRPLSCPTPGYTAAPRRSQAAAARAGRAARPHPAHLAVARALAGGAAAAAPGVGLASHGTLGAVLGGGGGAHGQGQGQGQAQGGLHACGRRGGAAGARAGERVCLLGGALIAIDAAAAATCADRHAYWKAVLRAPPGRAPRRSIPARSIEPGASAAAIGSIRAGPCEPFQRGHTLPRRLEPQRAHHAALPGF